MYSGSHQQVFGAGGVWNGMARIRYGVDLGNSKLWSHRRPCMVGF